MQVVNREIKKYKIQNFLKFILGLQKDLIYTKHEEYEIGWVMGQRAKAFELTINVCVYQIKEL